MYSPFGSRMALSGISWPAGPIKTPLEGWVFLPILSVYPSGTALPVYHSTSPSTKINIKSISVRSGKLIRSFKSKSLLMPYDNLSLSPRYAHLSMAVNLLPLRLTFILETD